jgi:hypothetical protein
MDVVEDPIKRPVRLASLTEITLPPSEPNVHLLNFETVVLPEDKVMKIQVLLWCRS